MPVFVAITDLRQENSCTMFKKTVQVQKTIQMENTVTKRPKPRHCLSCFTDSSIETSKQGYSCQSTSISTLLNMF